MERLTLSQALASNRLEDFVVQAENEGVGEVSTADFEAALAGLIGLPLEDRTSRLPGRGSTPGK